jgi:hypothetical protein
MAQAFLGLRVSLTLNTGLSLEGKVSHIDSDSQLLTLNDGKLDQYQLQPWPTFQSPANLDIVFSDSLNHFSILCCTDPRACSLFL